VSTDQIDVVESHNALGLSKGSRTSIDFSVDERVPRYRPEFLLNYN